jgi:hypothetical protein
MGQDGEDRKSDDSEVAAERTGPGRLAEFRTEARDAVRYERGLVLKAAVALLVVTVIVIIRELHLT